MQSANECQNCKRFLRSWSTNHLLLVVTGAGSSGVVAILGRLSASRIGPKMYIRLGEYSLYRREGFNDFVLFRF